jgi:hypothetical protein
MCSPPSAYGFISVACTKYCRVGTAKIDWSVKSSWKLVKVMERWSHGSYPLTYPEFSVAVAVISMDGLSDKKKQRAMYMRSYRMKRKRVEALW